MIQHFSVTPGFSLLFPNKSCIRHATKNIYFVFSFKTLPAFNSLVAKRSLKIRLFLRTFPLVKMLPTNQR